MNLTVAKNTFLKNLEKERKMSVQTNDFEKLIEVIQFLARIDIVNSIITKDEKIISETINSILDKDLKGRRDPIDILYNQNNIRYVKSTFIKKLYDSNRLANLLYEKEVNYSEKNMIDAFKLRCIRLIIKDVLSVDSASLNGFFLDFIRNVGLFTFIGKKTQNFSSTSFATSNSGYIKANSIKTINLSDFKKEEIINEFSVKFSQFIIELQGNNTRYYYYHKDEISFGLRSIDIKNMLLAK